MAFNPGKWVSRLLGLRQADYDDGRAVILPAIACLAILHGPQEPAAGWITIVAGSGVAPATVETVRTRAEAGLRRLREVFPDLPREPFRIVVGSSGEELQPALRAGHHSGSPGFALLGRNEIHVLLRETRASGARLDAVLVHEMAHEFIHQYCAPHGDRIPRWMHEGLAQFLAGDTYLGASEEAIVWRAATDQLLSFSDLAADFPKDPAQLQLAYAQSYSFVAWLERRFGMRRLLRALAAVDAETSMWRALVVQTQRSTVELEEEWRDYLLHGSGAGLRALFQQCFSLSLILALPLLALALVRRLRADQRMRRRLEDQEIARPEPGTMPPEAFAENPDESMAAADDVCGEDDEDDPGPHPRQP